VCGDAGYLGIQKRDEYWERENICWGGEVRPNSAKMAVNGQNLNEKRG